MKLTTDHPSRSIKHTEINWWWPPPPPPPHWSSADSVIEVQFDVPKKEKCSSRLSSHRAQADDNWTVFIGGVCQSLLLN
jgi:hypothetical protein